MSSTSFSLPHFDNSPMSVPMFHATDLVPAILLFYGLAVAFLGFRLSRFFCFTLGLVVGAYYVDNLFQSQSNVRHLGLPLVVITLVSLVSAVTWLLLHVVTLSALLGYVLALLVLVMDNGRVFGWGLWRWFPIIGLQAALLVAGRKNWTMLVVAATAVLGSLVTVLAIDHFADHTLSALLFTATYFRFLLGAQQAAPECGVDCWLLMLVWMVLSVVSFYVQLLLIQLQQTRLTKERQAVADDSVFSSTAFSYDTFSTSTASKQPTLPQASQLTPLISSASSSSFTLPTKASYNFFDPQRLPENLQPLYPVIQSAFDSIAVQYGFQAGNVSNQSEHLLFLLGNVKSRGVNDAISRLHAKVFGNYVEWSSFLSLNAYCSSTAAYAGVGSGPSPSHGTYSYRASSSLKLQEIALWLCIWGEAGSLRHTPEALCYIYHNMGAELHVHRDDDGKQRVGLTAPVRRHGQFLTDVIQPIFEVYRTEKGDAETKFRNYDDWNEFFWSTHCLHYYFASPKYFVSLSDDGESGTSQSTRLLPDSSLPPSVSEGLKACSKTHLERRSWLHPARSFMRLISFYFTIFHILVTIAYCRFRGWPLLGPDANRAISSFVISLAGWSVVKELIEIWAQYGIITQSVTNAAGFIMRLGIKTVAFGYLFAFYQWSIDWSIDYYDAYFVTACIYLLPYLFIVLAQIFPVLSLSPATATTPTTSAMSQWYRRIVVAISSFWYPTSALYVGHDVHESKQQTYTYQLFWLLLLSWKFYCSYLFQVTPLIEPTFQILTAKPKWTHIWHYNEIADTMSIFVLWIPFVLVYTFDTVIWYFMFQAVVGVLVGMSDRLGEIREFSALISAFTSLPWEFERKLLAWRAKEPHSIEPTPLHHEQQASYGIIGSEGSEERSGSVSSGGLDLSGSADDDDSHPSSDESRMLAEEYDLPVLVDQFRSTAWQNFAVAWNEVVEDLRHDDLLSNAEKQQLVFRMVPGSRKELYIPILLTAGCYENAVEKVGDVAHTYTESQTDANKQACTERLMTYLNHPIRREGIMELWESTQWLLSTLLGDRHEKDLATIYSSFEGIVSQGQMLSVVNADNLTKLKPALLNFVRAMRIAAASFTTFLESEKKKREAREGETRARVRELAEHERGMVSESDSEDEKDSPSSHPSSLHPLHTSKADKLSLKSILKSPSVGTLNILDTIRSHPRYQHSAVVVDDDEEENGRQYVILHLNLVRDQLQQFLNTLQSLVKPSTPESKTIGEKCKTILHDHHGFAWDDAYAGKCVHSVLKGSRISSVLTTLHAHLTVAQIDAEPSNSEATRRLMFFANSLFMHIPSAPSIASMKSWSTLTPFHSEDVLYSFADLEKQTEDGVSVFFYLQTIYPNEWANFLQRVGIPDNRVASILHSRKTKEARMWATNRGQTLGRTIDGMMLYEKALRLLAKLEQPTLYDVDIDEMVKQKFQYVVSAQVYGKQKRESDPKAAEIDIYLRKYPNMRVAYIDTLKVPRHDVNGKHIVVEEHYSVLIKSEGGEIKEVYRVQLPGNPILGEGKPENQNQAIIFTRGEYLQTIDMNQSNGFEEALKMRNLLEEFNPRPGQKAVGIVGFREHIYTGGLSSIAQYMALQEGCVPETDHRVMTDHGFLFLDEIEALQSRGVVVRYAAYDTRRRQLVYSNGQLYFPPQAPTHLVEFTEKTTQHHWDANSDDYGSTDHQRANRMSLRVTPGHQVYAQLADDESITSPLANDKLEPPCKWRAEELAPGYQCDCPPASDTCRHRSGTVRMLAAALGGFAPESGMSVLDTDDASPVVRLHLNTHTKLMAFLELYGYWLGTGSMQHRTRVCSKSDAVNFNTVKDGAHLRDLLPRAGLRRGVDWYECLSTESAAVKCEVFAVTNRTWFDFFDDQYWLKFKAGLSTAKSAQRMASWVFSRLDKAQLRALLSGLYTAGGCTPVTQKQKATKRRRDEDIDAGAEDDIGERCIFTSDVSFREQVMQTCVLAGYSAYFCATKPTDCWKVCYTEQSVLPHMNRADINFDGKSMLPLHALQPNYRTQSTLVASNAPIGACPYAPAIDGRLWCVTVDHPDHLIVMQRAHRNKEGIVTKVGRPLITGNCFVSQGQRVLDRPLRVRFHYGHPDVFDKLFFIGRGGVSKATKGINLSEDIFAGFNAILRGSSVVFREYIQVGKGRDVGLQQLYKFEAKLAQGNAMQCLSRDVYRLGQSLDFFRLLSFYFSGVGFYLSNSLTIWALYFFLYSRLLLAAFGVQKQDQFSGVETISYWFGMAGFLLTIPVFTTLGLERGFLNSAFETARMLLTGGPLFFMFHMGTKAYYFEQTILAGGAKYRPTGRGFVTRHEDFSEIYRFHASSHFYRAMEMVFLLTFYAIVIPWGFSYGLVTWAGWLIVVSWLLAPIWFNPLAFQWEKMVEDVGNFVDWMNRKEGDGDRSWKAWWKEEISYLNELNLERRIIVSLIGCRHAVVGYALLHYVHAAKMQLLVGSLMILLGLAALAVAQAKFGHRHQYNVRALKALIFFSVLSGLYYYYAYYHFTLPSLYNSGIVLIGLVYFLSTFTTVLLTMGVRHRYLIRYYKLVDYFTATFLLSVIALFSMTVVPSMIQTRLMFHNAFSRGVMIDKLLKLQEESGKDTTPNTDPSGSVPKAGYQADGADPTKPQFDFASIGFIERRTKSRLRLHGEEDEKERTGGRRGGKDESRHSNNGYTTEKEQAKKGREESSTGGKILTSGGLGGQSGRIPSYSSLSKLAEADDEEATPKTQPTHPSVQTSGGFGRGAAPMSVHTTTGTLSPLPVGSPSPQSGHPMHSPLGVNAPIPPTVATPPAGMAIPKTVSAQEYQAGTQHSSKPGRLSVKGMAAAIDERGGKDTSAQTKKPQ